MEEYQVKLNDISRKVGILITRYNELKERHQVLDEENKHLKQQLKDERKDKDGLTNEMRTLRLTKVIIPENAEEKTELKRKINDFIKEIDRCVAMLND